LSSLKYSWSSFEDKGKILLNGKTGIGMLIANQVSVSKKHYSAVAVAFCMLLHQYTIPASLPGNRRMGSTPMSALRRIGETVDANKVAGSTPALAMGGIVQW
jgi:hypothetical protein